MKTTVKIFTAAGLLLASQLPFAANAEQLGLAAKVNGVGISVDVLERSFEEYIRDNNINVGAIRYPQRLKEFKKEVLDLLISAELLWQQAQKTKTVAPDAEVEAAVTRVRNQFKSAGDFVKKIEAEGYTEESYRLHVKRMVTARKYLDKVRQKVQNPTDEDVHRFYTDNPDKFQMPQLLRARHILLKTNTAMDEKQLQAVNAKAEDLAKQIKDGADFAQLAKQHSEDVSAGQGGDLGFFAKGQMVKPFEEAAFALKPGEVSSIVKTRYGLHLIKVEQKRKAGMVSEAEAADQIRAFLSGQNVRMAEENEIQRLRGLSDVEVYTQL